MNANRVVFHPEFLVSLQDAINAHCLDGSCIAAAALAKAVGLEEEDANLIRDAMSRNFPDMEVRKGPGGGYKIKGLAEKKRLPEVTFDCQALSAEIARALSLTNGKPVSVGYFVSRLGLPPDGSKLVVGAVKGGLAGPFEVTTSGAIRRAKVEKVPEDAEVVPE